MVTLTVQPFELVILVALRFISCPFGLSHLPVIDIVLAKKPVPVARLKQVLGVQVYSSRVCDQHVETAADSSNPHRLNIVLKLIKTRPSFLRFAYVMICSIKS
jgi:hypothetical protein